jgi:hypothetical protein
MIDNISHIIIFMMGQTHIISFYKFPPAFAIAVR